MTGLGETVILTCKEASFIALKLYRVKDLYRLKILLGKTGKGLSDSLSYLYAF